MLEIYLRDNDEGIKRCVKVEMIIMFSFLKQLEKNANKNVYKLLIGNKCDLEDKRKVTYQEGKEFASSNGMQFIETSAKTDTKVKDDFEMLTQEIIISNVSNGSDSCRK